ncbi:MAG: hypothetical protein KGM14_01575 [Actinomycetales bacterium]|nr:hypothetical protein [Actinomycetales bacterium]
MANVVAPKGFVPSRYMDGSAWNGAANMYCIPSSDGSVFSPGDAVKTAAGGDANGIPYVQKAAGTDTVRGVVVGVLVANPNNPSLVGTTLDLTLQNIPATKAKDYYVLVADDPNILFEIQDDGLNAGTTVATACNKNATFTVANPTSPQQNSASVLNSGSIATTNTLNLKIVGLVQKPNNAYGANATWLVRFNLHELTGGTTGY